MAAEWEPADLDDLAGAKRRLEHPSLAAKLSSLLGTPVNAGFKLLPRGWHRKVNDIAETALFRGLEFAVLTIGKRSERRSNDLLHKALVFGTGTAGGALGLFTAAVELPVSTCIMLRSIADIAHSEGDDITQIETKLACLEVFALGGTSPKDDAAETGYWAVRGVLAKEISDATRHIAEKGMSKKGAPALVRLITRIAARFSSVVTEETAAKLVPVVGAVSGGVINLIFTNHFQDMARGHFVVRRLERKYGAEAVRAKYAEVEMRPAGRGARRLAGSPRRA
jgi:hypothetical protein